GRARASYAALGADDPTLSSHPAWLGLSARQCDRGHRLRPVPPAGAPFHRTRRRCVATSTSDSSYGYGYPTLWQYVEMNTTGTTETWRASSASQSACCRPRACL